MHHSHTEVSCARPEVAHENLVSITPFFIVAELPASIAHCPNHTRHVWARWDAYIYTRDPDTLFQEFKQRGASFVKELSFIDAGLWGFEVRDADGYVLAFFQLRTESSGCTTFTSEGV